MATAEEIRRAREETSVFAPLFEYARSRRSQLSSEGRRPVLGGLLSKEPVMGTDTLRYEGVGSLLATLLDPIARGVDAPRAAAQGLIPQEDMIGEAFGTAGTAMLGGGAVAKPAGSLGAFYGREGGSIQDALDLARSGRGIFHSSQADQFDEINKYGVEPQYGPWVKEIAEGATDDPSFLDDMPMAAWWSEQPNWVKMKTARAAGKNVNDVTVDDIRKYGHLSIADADEYADTVYRIPEEGIDYEGSEVSNLSGERMPLYATDLYEYGDDGVGRYPFGIERNELVTRESVEPKYSLTGQELVDFLKQYDGNTVSANTLRVYHGGPKRLSASEVEMRPDPEGTPIGFSVTDNPDVAEYYRKMRGGGSISEFDIDLDKANIISERELYEFIDDLENKLDADASYEQIQKGLLDAGIDAIEYPDPEFGIRVVNPNILGANASKGAGLLSVASDVSARGDQILSMLKSGRGSEVTDAMLDMGDGVKNTQLNQYLAENYDLPMDEASRLARAREMGFEGGLLHGTGSDITAVDPSKLGGKQNVLGKGFYQTTNPQRSDRYVPKAKDDDGSLIFAEGGNVMPLMTKSADEFDLTMPTGKENITRIANAFQGSNYNVELRDGGDSVFIQSKTDPSMSVFLDSYAEGQNTLMRLKDAFGNNNITPILQEAGFTGVKGVESRGSNVRVNYNPQDVRSQFARFDPRLAHLSNVTAANASPMSGLLAQSGVSSEQAQEIEDYLSRTGLLQ